MPTPSHPQLLRKLKRLLRDWRETVESPRYQMARPLKPTFVMNHCIAGLARALGDDGARKYAMPMLVPGVRCRHTLFGDGRVERQTSGSIVVCFDDHGTKEMLSAFIRGKLTRITPKRKRAA